MSIKRETRRFHVVVELWTSKKCTKKRDARVELLFWSLNLLFFFLKSSLWSSSSATTSSSSSSSSSLQLSLSLSISLFYFLFSFAKLKNNKNSIPAGKCDSCTNVMQIYLPYGSALVINFILDRILVFSFLVYKACLQEKADLLMFINEDCYL